MPKFWLYFFYKNDYPLWLKLLKLLFDVVIVRLWTQQLGYLDI